MEKVKHEKTTPNNKTPTARNIKKNGYKHAKLDAKLEKRRNEANMRQIKYDSLSLEQKLKVAQKRRGESNREIARINKLIENQNKSMEAVEKKTVSLNNQVSAATAPQKTNKNATEKKIKKSGSRKASVQKGDKVGRE